MGVERAHGQHRPAQKEGCPIASVSFDRPRLTLPPGRTRAYAQIQVRSEPESSFAVNRRHRFNPASTNS